MGVEVEVEEAMAGRLRGRESVEKRGAVRWDGGYSVGTSSSIA